MNTIKGIKFKWTPPDILKEHIKSTRKRRVKRPRYYIRKLNFIRKRT